MKCELVLIAGMLLLVACTHTGWRDDPKAWRKVELNLERVDPEGLRGPSDGKVAVAYEFCIPNTETCKREVRAIDSTVEFMAGSRGRIGCGKGTCLCIGSTHQAHYRSVLRALAQRPYIERITECYFE